MRGVRVLVLDRSSIFFVTFLTWPLFIALACVHVMGRPRSRLLTNMASSLVRDFHAMFHMQKKVLLETITYIRQQTWTPIHEEELLVNRRHNSELGCNIVALLLGHRGDCHGCRR